MCPSERGPPTVTGLFSSSATKRAAAQNYDNMKSVVKKILRGYQRVETDRIIAFRSHWGYLSEYCNPASGNEKAAWKVSWAGSGATCLCPCRRPAI